MSDSVKSVVAILLVKVRLTEFDAVTSPSDNSPDDTVIVGPLGVYSQVNWVEAVFDSPVEELVNDPAAMSTVTQPPLSGVRIAAKRVDD